jgi:glycosyltransferase involved in cell wall biosynthesis
MDTTEESNYEKDLEKEQDNDYERLNKMEVIQFYSHVPKKSSRRNKYIYIIVFALIFLILISSCAYYFLYYKKGLTIFKKFKNKGPKKTGKTGPAKGQPKATKESPKNVKANKKAPPQKPKAPQKIIPKKPGIAFLYPKLTEYIVTTGEYLVRLHKYSIFYLLQAPRQEETQLKFSKNITRINAYYDQKMIEKTVKNQNIKYLIVNDALSKKELIWLKGLGVKLIGVFNDVFISSDVKTSRNFNNMWRYDAFIQDCPYDFDTFTKNNITKNIFIPNIYDTTKTKLSSLNNHNILLLGKLNDKDNGVINAITAMSSIIKEFPDTKLNIISKDSQTLNINQLIRKYGLNKNIYFLPFDTKISYYCKDSSLFIYSSLIEECKTAIKEAMSHGLPCVISNDISKNLFFQEGIIKLNITREKELSNEIIKLLKDNKYKNKMGMGAKLSLDKINDDALATWDKLFSSLQSGNEDFQKLRSETQLKYTKKKETKVATNPPTQKAEAKAKKAQPAATTPHKKVEKDKKTPPAPAKKTPPAPAKKTPAAPAKKTIPSPAKKTPAAPAKKTIPSPAKKTPAAPAKKTPAAPAKKTPAAPAKKAPAAPLKKTILKKKEPAKGATKKEAKTTKQSTNSKGKNKKK